MSLTGSAKAGFVLRGKVSKIEELHGYSAYEIAVINGFEGTEEEWLLSLKGEKGADGKSGEDGKDYILTAADKTEIADAVKTMFVDVSEVGQ